MKSAVRLCLISSLPALLAVPTCIGGAQSTHNLDLVVPQVQTFALTGTKDLTQQGVKMEDAEYRGRKAVRLTTLVDADIDGMALVNGTQFRDGTIEVDVASKSTRPPGVRMPGFIGIAFRTSPDLEHYELLYIRPGNSRSDDQAMRNHSVQYVSSPGYGWERLRRQWPYIYEAYAELQPEQWTHIKIDVHSRKAVLYLNGSADPASSSMA